MHSVKQLYGWALKGRGGLAVVDTVILVSVSDGNISGMQLESLFIVLSG